MKSISIRISELTHKQITELKEVMQVTNNAEVVSQSLRIISQLSGIFKRGGSLFYCDKDGGMKIRLLVGVLEK